MTATARAGPGYILKPEVRTASWSPTWMSRTLPKHINREPNRKWSSWGLHTQTSPHRMLVSLLVWRKLLCHSISANIFFPSFFKDLFERRRERRHSSWLCDVGSLGFEILLIFVIFADSCYLSKIVSLSHFKMLFVTKTRILKVADRLHRFCLYLLLLPPLYLKLLSVL